MEILIPTTRNEDFEARKFIDYDKGKKIFYDNLYLDEFKIVVKIPLFSRRKSKKKEDIKIKKFNLERYTYLTSY
ncbi:MAG: hypothetical protein ACFFDK_12070 [Promethearchaeota archaeon]